MRTGGFLLAWLLLLAPITGCIGGDEAGDPIQKQRADVTETLGGLEGVVTDNAVQPVVGATVTLVETNQTAETAEDGSYALSRVEPGTYTVSVRADGFVSARETVEIRAGEVAVLDFLVTHLVSQEAYTQQIEVAGFVECGIGWYVEPDPVYAVTSNSLAACAVPNIVADNTTNDKFLHYVELEAPIDTLVYEMTWETEGSALWTNLEVAGHSDDAAGTFVELSGNPPLYQRVEKPTFETIASNFTEICEGTNGSEPNDAYCGYNFWDQGWPLQTRVFASSDCNELPARVCPLLQEKFTHYLSAFYNAPAPEGFAVIDGNGQQA